MLHFLKVFIICLLSVIGIIFIYTQRLDLSRISKLYPVWAIFYELDPSTAQRSLLLTYCIAGYTRDDMICRYEANHNVTSAA